ncbi:MAG TPA: flagellar export chaperone FlgN [Syntrophorhabdaceae bacterium]|nr:flagellar export chaperone FlgN [Syntrophorhabdaceae bacterium]
MNDKPVIELARKEQKALKEFLKVLQGERDAIISFSLEGIIQENNRKEEILRKLEYLKMEKEKLFESLSDKEEILDSQTWQALTKEMHHTMKEIKIALQKNMKLLSFSIDHVRSSIEHIIGFLNTAPAYGKKPEQRPVLFSKVI